MIDAITEHQMPSGTFHYYLCAKLNADVMFLYDVMAAARVVLSDNMSQLHTPPLWVNIVPMF